MPATGPAGGKFSRVGLGTQNACGARGNLPFADDMEPARPKLGAQTSVNATPDQSAGDDGRGRGGEPGLRRREIRYFALPRRNDTP